jgi:hypothetical protein
MTRPEEEEMMAGNKGKPSGPYAESKTGIGKKANYKRSGWPEDAPTERVESGENQQQGKPRALAKDNFPGTGRGRNRKAGSPV